LEKNNDIFLCNLGVAHMELSQFEKAAELFRKAYNLNPSNEDARILLDECLENL
jgi:tetratricopeptide (TPR) repeat protein